MEFQIKPAVGKEELVQQFYTNHSTYHDGDCGLDLFCLENVTVPAHSMSCQIPLGIHVSVAKLKCFVHPQTDELCYSYDNNGTRQGFFLFPRSSTGSKTPLRLSNSVGIVDGGYRGELISIVDNVSNKDFTLLKGERYFQICLPTLGPFTCKVVKELDNTSRGEGGLGSTNFK